MTTPHTSSIIDLDQIPTLSGKILQCLVVNHDGTGSIETTLPLGIAGIRVSIMFFRVNLGTENKRYGVRIVSSVDGRYWMDPISGFERATKSAGSLMVVIAPKARIRVPGKASANLLAAPRRVDPRVIMSSTIRISFGGGPAIRRWTLRLTKCSLGFGLSDALLDAAFLTAVTRTRHESTWLPTPLLAKAVAIRRGTQSVSGSIRELFGTGTRTVSG